MVIQPRAYQAEQDLDALRTILVAGRQAGVPTHYVHVGDLHWWLFYLNQADDRRQTIYLWEEAATGHGVVGWTLFSPGFAAFDVFVHPTLRASEQATQIWLWSEEAMASGMCAQGEQQIYTCGVAEHDTWLQTHLTERGFVRDACTLAHLTYPLTGVLPAPCLPTGYQVRPVAGEYEAEPRAAPAHAAFGSQTPFAHDWPRYLAFMRSPCYTPALDLVIEAPDGQLVAFCLCWVDEMNRVGYLESVGVHPAFQRRGLGRAVIAAGLRLLQAQDMITATARVALDNLVASRFYQQVGFLPAYPLYTYKKDLG